MIAYYNENDPYAAQWLRNLIDAGHIAWGDVDERSIADVSRRDLAGYTQCHFFAGIGGWSLALRLAEWPDDRKVWTGSCPCQPFSDAGKRHGTADKRHLWPEWFKLIRERRPAIIFGEQVASAIRRGWLDAVFADLEAQDYTCWAPVLPACSVGAPHIRQRLWFMADSDESGRERARVHLFERRPQQAVCDPAWPSDPGELANALQSGRTKGRPITGSGPAASSSRSSELADADLEHGRRQYELGGGAAAAPRQQSAGNGGVGDAASPRRQGFEDGVGVLHPQRSTIERAGGHAFWTDAEWLPCTDGKARPVEPGTFPLAHGVPARVGRLRAYGNAIVPQVAAEFIKACGL